MEKNIDFIGEELFNKIRGRFPSVTLGNAKGVVTNDPKEARFFDFDFMNDGSSLGKVSVSLDEKSLNVMYAQNFVEDQLPSTKNNWYNFLRELRIFSRKRLLNFDIRDLNKSNLNRRDYNFLAKNSGEQKMTESRLYGTSKNSYQDIGSARISIKHSQPVNHDLAAGRTQHIENIYIENAEGERFKYPIKHLNGARAMARHISEGGTMYDDFGNHIVGLSEELGKLRKFKNYVNRSSVMAEGLAEYSDIVAERIDTVKKTLESIQKERYYKGILENFSKEDLQEVPDDIAENWIDQLTIKQFNEELQDVFPYIYKLISENRSKAIGPDQLVGEGTPVVQNDNAESVVVDEFEDWANDVVQSALEEDELKPKQKIPVTEFILSMYDRETGQFPKGETAVLTAVEKDYGESLINPAKQFIEAINQKFQEYHGYNVDADDILTDDYVEEKRGNQEQFTVAFSSSGQWVIINHKRNEVEYVFKDEKEARNKAAQLNKKANNNSGNRKRFKVVQSPNGQWKIFDNIARKVVYTFNSTSTGQNKAQAMAAYLNKDYLNKDQETENVEEDLIDPKPKSDRRYFVVPNMEDYYDIQNDRRFAGSIEVADENSEVMVLPNSRFHKLKMMYGDKVQEVDPQFTRTYENDVEESGLQYYLGKKKYGKDGMAALAQAGRDGASQEELGKIKDKYIDDSMDILRLAGIK